MVCYARRAASIAGIALVILLVFGRSAAHALDMAALMVAIGVVAGGTLLAALLVFVALRSVRRKRALAGGCVACQLKCQHAQVGTAGARGAVKIPPARLWLVSTADRVANGQAGVTPRPAVAARPAAVPARAAVTARAAVPSAVVARPAAVVLPAPRWPDAPAVEGAVARERAVTRV
jgi:hypothetical protein